MRSKRAWRAARVAWACGMAACMGVAIAAPTRPSAPPLPDDAIPRPGAVLVDPDFGVSTREFGLDRQVQMYQWRRSGDQLERVWSAGRIESADFGADHQNPALPIDSQRWWARDATLDGHPIDETVLQGLGEWRPFRPAFSDLPLNMAATFQPEGDGLGSAENPLAPAVGDLRITWRELHLPPLTGRLELRDGRWQLSPRTAAAALNAAPLPPVVDERPAVLETAADVVAPPAGTGRRWWWALGIAAMLSALAVGVAVRRRG